MERVVPLYCCYCTASYSDGDSLVRHLKDACPLAPRGRVTFWRCGNCPTIARDRWRLKQHLTRVHNPSAPSFTPSYVGSSTSSQAGDGSALPSPPLGGFPCDGAYDAADDVPFPPLLFVPPPALPVKTNPEIVSLLTRELAAIAADSLEDTDMTEKIVQFFMARFMHYQQSVHSLGLDNLYNRLATGCGLSSCCLNILNSFLNEHKSLMESAFKPMWSTHTRMAYFVEQGSYIPPQPVFAKSDLETALECVPLTDRDIHLGLGQKDQFVHFVPMRKVLKKIFEIPGFLREVLEWGEKCAATREVTCFQESEVWLKAARSRDFAKPGSYFFPLHVFYDDFEAGNALGSHSAVHKLGGCYYSLPFVPPRFASKLKFIMLAAVFKSRVRELEGNKAVFAPVIDELNFLYEQGITVQIEDGQTVNIQFGLGCLIGGNLGLNSILGFTSSFNSSSCCRVCRIRKNQYNSILREEPALLRTSDNFQQDLEAGVPSETGVVENCVWQALPYFRLETHCSVDFMHDMFEGCAKYVMMVVLKGLVHRNKAFTLSLLNDRLKNLDYGPDSDAKPLSIGSAASQGFNIRMSASEMRTFVHYFGLMVGHTVVVRDYDHDTLGTEPVVPRDDDDDGDVDDNNYDDHGPSTSSSRPLQKRVSPKRGRSGKVSSGNHRKRQKARHESEGDAADFYKLYLIMNEVITMISQTSVSLYKARDLADAIQFFLARFIRLSNLLSRSEDGVPPVPAPLQPKFHFLTHYPSMMLKHGPLPALSSFRFESKNKQLKTGLKNSFSNINTPFSAAKKEQYHLNHLFFHNTLPGRFDEPGKCSNIIDNSELVELTLALALDCTALFSIKVVTTDDGIKFVPGYVVAMDVGNEGLPVFSKIVSMYFDKLTNETYFKGQDYETTMFSPHYRAYAVDALPSFSFHKLSDRRYAYPNTLIRALDHNYYVVMRNSL